MRPSRIELAFYLANNPSPRSIHEQFAVRGFARRAGVFLDA